MYTVTILKSIPKSQTSFKDMLDPKRSKFGPKGPKMGGAKFFRTVNLNFEKEDHKNSFYTKNHPNSMNRLEAKMLILGQKGANLDQKGSKRGMARFFPDCKPQFFQRRP